LDARLRSAGFNRLVHLPDGAAASGAARIGEQRLRVPADLGDIPVETAVPLSLARCSAVAPWEARLQKVRLPSPRPAPTHVILDGIGHPLGGKGRFTIGAASAGPDVTLPDAFNIADDCSVPLLREGGRLWFVEPGNGNGHPAAGAHAGRTAVEAGDRLTIRCGAAAADVLFAHCANGQRAHD
jgi:hypothetical protein